MQKTQLQEADVVTSFLEVANASVHGAQSSIFWVKAYTLILLGNEEKWSWGFFMHSNLLML